MKNTSRENIAVSNVIGESLSVAFNNKEFSLGKWGEVDNWSEIEENTIILLECEKGQKHPNTNVLKLFPYLEENPNLKIILLHYFYPPNKTPKNRLALCNYIAEKMKKEFDGRFYYLSLRCQNNEIGKKLKKYEKELAEQLLTGKKRSKH